MIGQMLGCVGSATTVPAEGTLTVRGQPIENVLVTFYPVNSPDTPEAIASGVTDSEGKYVLMRDDGKEVGALIGENTVTLTEAPVPDQVKTMDAPLAIESYRASLSHRPLPVVYARRVDSPLKIDVQPNQSDYPLEIGQPPRIDDTDPESRPSP